jgi:adenine phosphoribosyltransferase
MDPSTVENETDGPVARRIAESIPYYPFHGVPRFYDISGMLQDPELFQLCVDVFARRYAALEVDCIAGVDARGFILGPPIALALKKVGNI